MLSGDDCLFNSPRTLSLGDLLEIEEEKMRENKIAFRKQSGKLNNKSRKDAKLEKCFYCNKPSSSFCNSHSVPAFSLRNIAVDGGLYTHNKLVNLPLMDEDKGVNRSGTFQLICRECDSRIFKDYEDPDNYVVEPTSKMIAQIAMKNHLKSISKRNHEISLYKNMKENYSLPDAISAQKEIVNQLDLQEYITEFKKAKRIDEKGWDNEYYLFHHQILDYVVPIAAQTTVALLTDFEGNVINDIYNLSSTYKIQSIHICVFPLETTSVIMMFVDSTYKRCRPFYKQFKKLTSQDKLAAINFILFNYCEDVFINKNVDEEVLKHEGLINISQQTFDVITTVEDVLDAKEIGKEGADLSKINDVPNLLSEKFKVR